MITQHALIRILSLFLLAYLGLVVYANRALFFSTFDEPYWRDKYEHSQWRLPLSRRIIGDDGLYLYEGYRLIRGGDPTLLNAEVPPLGKYLIGASIVLFGNGHVFGMITTALLVFFVYILARSVTGSALLGIGSALLTASDPLITAQYPLTMLDSLQAACLLAFLSATLLIKRNHILSAGLGGIALGFFAESKFPLLLPVPLIIGVYVLWKRSKRILPPLVFLSALTAGYLLPYVPYFLTGNTPADWLRTQKFILSFYMRAGLTPTWGSEMANLFVGTYQNIFSRRFLPSPSWSPLWPILTITFFSYGALRTKGTDAGKMVLYVTGALITAIYAFIPFWTRYLVLVLPLYYIPALTLLKRYTPKIQSPVILMLFAIQCLASLPSLFPTPEGLIKQFTYEYKHMFFRDIYQNADAATKNEGTAESFSRFGLKTIADAQIDNIETLLSPQPFTRFRSPQTFSMDIVYTTRHLGSWKETKNITVAKEHGRWVIPWKWSYLMDGLTSENVTETIVTPARRGAILGSDKKPIARDFESYLVWATPGLVDTDKETAMLKFFETLAATRIQAIAFHQRLHGNTAPDLPVPLFVLPRLLTPAETETLAAYPGVSLTPAYARANYGSTIVTVGEVANTVYGECCSWLYSTTNYDGVSGVEQAKNDLLKGYSGGSLVVRGAEGNIVRTILSVEKKNGEDVEP